MHAAFPTCHLDVTAVRENAVQIAGVVAPIVLLGAIAYGDVRTRRIPNTLCLGIAVLGLVRIVFDRDVVAAGESLAIAAAVFSAGFGLFRRGALGGGDVKLVTAMALLIRHQEVLGFLVLMSVCGAALALVTIAREIFQRYVIRIFRPVRTKSQLGVTRVPTLPERLTIPYGVAIAAAGAITLILER